MGVGGLQDDADGTSRRGSGSLIGAEPGSGRVARHEDTPSASDCRCTKGLRARASREGGQWDSQAHRRENLRMGVLPSAWLHGKHASERDMNRWMSCIQWRRSARGRASRASTRGSSFDGCGGEQGTPSHAGIQGSGRG